MSNTYEESRAIRRNVRASFEQDVTFAAKPTFESIQKAVVAICNEFDGQGLEVESAKIRGFIDGLFYSGPHRPADRSYMIGFDHGRESDLD